MDAFDEDLDLNNLTCRICIGNFDTSNSLYDLVEYDEKVELKDIFKRVTNVEIANEEESIPTRICNNCTERLLNAYELVCQVEKSEYILQNYLEKKNDNKDTIEIAETIISDFKSAEQEESIGIDDYDAAPNEEYEILEEYSPNTDTTDPITFEIDNAATENEIELEEKVPVESDMDFDYSADRKIKKEIKDESSGPDRTSNSVFHFSSEIESKKSTENNFSHQCLQCHRKFAKAETLKKHIKASHTYASPEEIAALIPNPPKEQFTCTYCPRTFARKDNLMRHLQVVHHVKVMNDINTKKHIYKRGLCPYCGESFSQASLIVHIRRHTGETPYRCSECNKGFPRRQDLTIHQRKHTGERPHVCTVCGKTFSRPNKLTRHMRIHTGERPYKCMECDRSFAQSNDLNIHIRRHTGEKPYKCTVCGEAFISGTALKSHRKLKGHDAQESELVIDPFEKIRVNNRKRTIVEKRTQTKTEILDNNVIVEFINEP